MLMLFEVDAVPQVVPATCFQKDTHQHLIITGQVILVAPVAAKVLQYMEMYGKKESVNWYKRVVEFIWCMLNNGNQIKEECLFIHCLKFRVTEILGTTTLQHDTQLAITDGWVESALDVYKFRAAMCGDMYELATYTFQYINSCIGGHTIRNVSEKSLTSIAK